MRNTRGVDGARFLEQETDSPWDWTRLPRGGKAWLCVSDKRLLYISVIGKQPLTILVIFASFLNYLLIEYIFKNQVTF